jgi:hypothetical protein
MYVCRCGCCGRSSWSTWLINNPRRAVIRQVVEDVLRVPAPHQRHCAGILMMIVFCPTTVDVAGTRRGGGAVRVSLEVPAKR